MTGPSGSDVVPVPLRALERFGRASVLALRTSTRRQVFAPTLSAHSLVGHASTGGSAGGAAGGSTGGWSREAARRVEVGAAGRRGAEISAAIASWTPPAGSVARWDWHLRRELAARVLEQAANGTSADLVDDDISAHFVDDGAAVLAWRRPGPADSEDADHCWWSAAASASVEVGVPLACLVIVTRWGWWSLPEGPSRRWARLRQHTSVVSTTPAS